MLISHQLDLLLFDSSIQFPVKIDPDTLRILRMKKIVIEIYFHEFIFKLPDGFSWTTIERPRIP